MEGTRLGSVLCQSGPKLAGTKLSILYTTWAAIIVIVNLEVSYIDFLDSQSDESKLFPNATRSRLLARISLW